MIKLSKLIDKWDSPNFKVLLKDELQNIKPSLLPLQKGLSLSSYVGQAPFSAVILNTHEHDNCMIVKTGIFYTGIIAGCSCSDDPSPVDEQNEYCELQFTIHKKSAETEVTLLD